MLFDKIEHAFKEFQKNKDKLQSLGDGFRELAKNLNEAELKHIKK